MSYGCQFMLLAKSDWVMGYHNDQTVNISSHNISSIIIKVFNLNPQNAPEAISVQFLNI